MGLLAVLIRFFVLIPVSVLAPFIRLLPREIPHPRSQHIRPVNAYTIGFHSAYGLSENRGWEITNPLALVEGYPCGNDLRLLNAGEGGARNDGIAEDETVCRVRALKQGEHPTLLLDFGRLCAGRFHLTLSDAPDGARIDIAYGESLNTTYIDRYTCREGAQTFSPTVWVLSVSAPRRSLRCACRAAQILSLVSLAF